MLSKRAKKDEIWSRFGECLDGDEKQHRSVSLSDEILKYQIQ
jgi:hypothetical protein